ncbi:MAG TPA: molybdopterin cofactor-binding domain-containing protein, partial [Crenalkalicoccus sp.]|nr:molybdopterin cofactor-binding domain-containing protein [Crenalkalicoccus sp.]
APSRTGGRRCSRRSRRGRCRAGGHPAQAGRPAPSVPRSPAPQARCAAPAGSRRCRRRRAAHRVQACRCRRAAPPASAGCAGGSPPDPAGTPLFPGYGSNLANRYLAGRGDPDRAFAEADLVIRRSFHAHRHGAAPLETRGLLAVPEADGVLRVYGATKVTQFNRRALARMLGRAEDSLDLVEVDVGGSFGARGEFYPEDFLIPFAALRFGAPVKWIEDRREHLLTCNHSREIDADVELALRRDGSFLGLRATLRADMGAYIRTNGGVVPAKAGQFLPGPYRIPHVALTVESWFTNKTPIGTLRGPGRYETHFFRERLIDIAATDLGLDPAEIRLRNLLTPEEMPYDTGRLVPYEPPSAFDSGDFPQGLRTALEALGYAELKAQAGKPGPDGRRHGIGLACFAESSGAGPSETARVTLCPDGRIEVATGISTSGQGHETVLAQICAESFGGAVPPRDITILHGTASIMPQGFGTYHSRAVVVGGSAILRAAEALRARLLAVAGERLQLRAAELTLREGGVWREGGTAPLADMATLAAWAPEASATETFPMPKRTYTCGAHAAHVAVDVETGQVEVLRYIAVEDVGRAINPLLVHGQAVGAAVQGIGATFLDEYVYDAEGQLLTGSLADYLLPTATCFPHVEAITLEEAPSALNPLGAKGAGEGGIVACGAAIANAVASALGADVTVLPLSPDRVLRLIPEEAAAT